MKTTIDIDDELLRRAKQVGRDTGRPLRAVVEEGLRAVVFKSEGPNQYFLPDHSIGSERDPDPLANYTWPELRDIIYGDDDSQ